MQFEAPKTKEPQDRLDSPATFARFAGVTPQCVRNWCHQGIIPTVIHAGRIIRFDRAAAIKALANETAGTAAGKGSAR
jgi:phage terminase Nu1 subunit (DNA packaging protein)